MDAGDVACRRNLPRDGNGRRQAALQEALRTTPLFLRDHSSRLLHSCQSKRVYCAGVLTSHAIGSLNKTHEFRHQEVSSLEDMDCLYLKIAAFHKIVEDAIQLLFAGFRVAAVLDC